MAKSRSPSPPRAKDPPDDTNGALYSSMLTVLAILQQIQATLQRSIAPEIVNSRLRFWTTYKSLADEYDADFLEKYHSNMDTVMIFAGLFTAVSATFVGMIQPALSPDPNLATQALLQAIFLTLNGTVVLEPIVPMWDGPSATDIWVQSLLFASLSCSVSVALGAVLGKQWLNYYSSVGERGSTEARGLDRQRKLAGQKRYRFDTVLEILPVLLQLSLLLFGLAISVFIFNSQRTVGIVLIAVNVAGVLLYFYVVGTSLLDPNSPFSSPVTTIIIQFLGPLAHALAAMAGQLGLAFVVTSLVALVRRYLPPASTVVIRILGNICDKARKYKDRHWGRAVDEEALMIQPSKSFGMVATDEATDDTSEVSLMAFKWVLDTSTDPVAVSHALQFAPEVYWTDISIGQLSFDLLDRIIVGLTDSFRQIRNERFEVSDLFRHQAVAYSTAFLFFYWEKLAVDPEGFKMWLRALDGELIKTWLQRWKLVSETLGISSFLQGDAPTGDTPTTRHEGRELFFLIYLTFDHLQSVHSSPADPTPILRCRTSSSSTMDMLQARTFVYLAQHVRCLRIPAIQVSNLLVQLARRVQSGSALGVYAFASGILIRIRLHPDRRPQLADILTGESLTMQAAVNNAFCHAESFTSKIGYDMKHGVDEWILMQGLPLLSNFVQILRIQHPDEDYRNALRRANIPSRSVAACAPIPFSIPSGYPVVTPSLLLLTSELLATGIAYASTSLNPWRADDQIWGSGRLPVSHMGWLVDFLDALQSRAFLSEDEVQTGATHALSVIASLEGIGSQIDNERLIHVLDWTLRVSPAQALSSSDHREDPIRSLHRATLHCIHALLQDGAGPPPHDRCRLIQNRIPNFIEVWCSIQAAVAHNDEHCNVSFTHVLALLAQSASEDSWINDPENSVMVRQWVGIVGRRARSQDLSELLDVEADKLVAWRNVFDVTDSRWYTQQVAFAILRAGWRNTFHFIDESQSQEYQRRFESWCIDRTAELLLFDFWPTENQELLDYKWYMDRMLYWLRKVSHKSKSKRLRVLRGQVEGKLKKVVHDLISKKMLPGTEDAIIGGGKSTDVQQAASKSGDVSKRENS